MLHQSWASVESRFSLWFTKVVCLFTGRHTGQFPDSVKIFNRGERIDDFRSSVITGGCAYLVRLYVISLTLISFWRIFIVCRPTVGRLRAILFHHIWELLVAWNRECSPSFQLCFNCFLYYLHWCGRLLFSKRWIFLQTRSACFVYSYEYNTYLMIWFLYFLCLHNPKLTLAFLYANLAYPGVKEKLEKESWPCLHTPGATKIVNIST